MPQKIFVGAVLTLFIRQKRIREDRIEFECLFSGAVIYSGVLWCDPSFVAPDDGKELRICEVGEKSIALESGSTANFFSAGFDAVFDVPACHPGSGSAFSAVIA